MSYFDNKPLLSEADKTKAKSLVEKQKSEPLSDREKNWLSEVYKKGKAPPDNPDMPWRAPKKITPQEKDPFQELMGAYINENQGIMAGKGHRDTPEESLDAQKRTIERLEKEIKEIKPVGQIIAEAEEILHAQKSKSLSEEEKEWIKKLHNESKEPKVIISPAQSFSLFDDILYKTSCIILATYAVIAPIFIGYEIYKINNTLLEISQSLQEK